MSLGFFQVPVAKNEPIYSYAPGSAEKAGLEVALKELKSKETEVPMYIGSELVFSGDRKRMSPPHDHTFTLGYFHAGNEMHVKQAIDAAWEYLEAVERLQALTQE